ncbi:hypothetical protein H2136_13030 [Aeromonas hydrophila]|uniref:Uncharacterized protein n=1 Tax=Aeromonas hydrophila TaxID=644 RepID=A0A926ITM4_AERHY|nr:hypothetical protein [Aeromonas hydrophila]
MDNASQQYNVSDLAKFMCRAKDSNKPFVFFTGAGCSVTSGIPLAKKLIEEIHKHFETELKLLVGTDREDYGKCMAQIGRDDRRRFLKKAILTKQRSIGLILPWRAYCVKVISAEC